MVGLILVVLAFVLALIEALRPYLFPAATRPHLGWLAVSLYFLSLLLSRAG